MLGIAFVVLLCGLPVIVLGLYIYLKDREREPMDLLIKLLGKGILACLLVLLVSGILGIFFPIFGADYTTLDNKKLMIYAFICVALVEESCKYFF